MQSPSFLAHQRRLAQGQELGRSNCQTLFAMDEVPSDNHIRAMLDPVEPRHFDAVFDATLAALEQSGGLAASRRLGGHVLIAFEYFRSDKLSCLNCSTRARAGGMTEHSTVWCGDAGRPPATTVSCRCHPRS